MPDINLKPPCVHMDTYTCVNMHNTHLCICVCVQNCYAQDYLRGNEKLLRNWCVYRGWVDFTWPYSKVKDQGKIGPCHGLDKSIFFKLNLMLRR